MTGEIDKDFYCSADSYNESFCDDLGWADNDVACEGKDGCKNYHRKHPTPEQFEAEYGYEYSNDAPVWSRAKRVDGTWSDWQVSHYGFAKCTIYEVQIVCACTPWGKPPREYV